MCEKAGEKEEEDKTFYLSTLNKDKVNYTLKGIVNLKGMFPFLIQ